MQTCKVLNISKATRRLYSAMVKDEGAVEYKPNERVFPHDGCGPLTVFVNLEAARNFIDCYGLDTHLYEDFAIYTCECELSTHTRLWIKMPSHCYRPTGLEGYPPGTLFAKRVMLKEEVNDNTNC